MPVVRLDAHFNDWFTEEYRRIRNDLQESLLRFCRDTESILFVDRIPFFVEIAFKSVSTANLSTIYAPSHQLFPSGSSVVGETTAGKTETETQETESQVNASMLSSSQF